LLANDSNIHAGIRTTLSGPSDYENDGYCGFEIVEAREIDTIGTAGIIKKIRERVGTTKPVYLSIDIDTLDPACMTSFLLPWLFSYPTVHIVCNEQKLRNLQSHPQPAPPKPAAGPPASCAPSCAASRA
jgi:hypothetical protein